MKNLLFIISCFLLFFPGRNKAQSNNIDFEATIPGVYTTSNAVTGWTITSQTATSCNTSTLWAPGSPEFSVVSTPLLNIPFIGTLPNSPLGGNNIVSLGNLIANASNTKISRTIAVTYSNSVLCYAYAGLFENGTHNCCEQSSFKIEIRNASGTLLSCLNQSLIIPGCNAASTFSISSNNYWTNWQSRYVDLFPYIGTTLSLDIICSDCTSGDHYGSLYFDLLAPQVAPPGCSPATNVPFSLYQNHFCVSPNAVIDAAAGFATYSWTAPTGYPISPSQSSLSSLTLTNAVVGNIYTLNITSPSGCSFTAIDTLNFTQVSIMALGAIGSCSMGASGSATVIAAGSGSGYTYQWTNSTASVVGTSSSVNNLPQGTYSVVVSGAGSNSLSCGTAIQTVTLGVVPRGVINYLKPFCAGQQATLSIAGGTNYQWYNNLTAISPTAGGTASSYTLPNPLQGTIYQVTYISSQGCKDSIRFTLAQMPPGNVSVIQNILVCPSATNGIVTISLTPAAGSPPGNNSFHIFSTGTASPYSASVAAVNSLFFTAYNLSAGQTYSVHASEGSCNYTTSFSVTPYIFDYTVSPATGTMCPPNGHAPASITFPTPNSLNQYSFSWAPQGSVFSLNTQNTILTLPTPPPGSMIATVYTVVVTPNSVNCPITKTFTITTIGITPPTIAPIPTLCANASIYSITAIPPGGIFNSWNGSISQAGLLSTNLASSGVNAFTYDNSIGSCISQATATFFIASASLIASNSSSIFCGQTITLSASGANNYLWSSGSTNSSISVSPLSTTIYSVTGTNISNSCSKTQSIQVSVTSSLVISIAGSPSLCIGDTGTLSGVGATTYTWNNGTINSNLLISPQIPTSYSVTGTDLFGCKASAQHNIFVYPRPQALVAGNFSICPGIETTLLVYNIYTYSWSTGATSNTIHVSPPVTTTYTVTGKDFYGCADTKTITVVVSGCVGLDELKNNSEINIYPNPAQGKLFIEVPEKTNIFITDALGKIILEKELEKGKHVLDLSVYNNGVYLVRTIYKGEVKNIKLIKND